MVSYYGIRILDEGYSYTHMVSLYILLDLICRLINIVCIWYIMGVSQGQSSYISR